MPYTFQTATGPFKIKKGDLLFFRATLYLVRSAGPFYIELRPQVESQEVEGVSEGVNFSPRPFLTVESRWVASYHPLMVWANPYPDPHGRGGEETGLFIVPPDEAVRVVRLLDVLYGPFSRRSSDTWAVAAALVEVAIQGQEALQRLLEIPEGVIPRLNLARALAPDRAQGVRALVLAWSEPLVREYLEGHGFQTKRHGFTTTAEDMFLRRVDAIQERLHAPGCHAPKPWTREQHLDPLDEVRITTFRSAHDPLGRFELRVQDRGPGLDPMFMLKVQDSVMIADKPLPIAEGAVVAINYFWRRLTAPEGGPKKAKLSCP